MKDKQDKCPVCDKAYVHKELIEEQGAAIVINQDRDETSRINSRAVSTGAGEVHVKNNTYTGGVDIYFHV